MIILPLNKLKDHFYFIKTLKIKNYNYKNTPKFNKNKSQNYNFY